MEVRELTDDEILDQGTNVEEEDNRFRDDYEIKNHFLIVHSKGIKKEIASDIVMAKFEDKDEKYVLALRNLAKTSNNIFEEMIRNLENKKSQHWVKRGLNEKQKQKEDTKIDKKVETLKIQMQQNYDLFMGQIELLSCLRRNKEDNHILRLASGLEDKRELPEHNIPIREEKESILAGLLTTKKPKKED